MFDGADKFHRFLEVARLAGVLEMAAPDLLVEVALPLPGNENGRDPSAMKPPACSWWGATTRHPRCSAMLNRVIKQGSGIPNRVSIPSISSSCRILSGMSISLVSVVMVFFSL
jgi:hypothetical protein